MVAEAEDSPQPGGDFAVEASHFSPVSRFWSKRGCLWLGARVSWARRPTGGCYWWSRERTRRAVPALVGWTQDKG